MASSYVNNLRLDEMATGDGSGTWGTTTNTNLTLIGEAFGYATVAVADASTDTLTIPNGTETDSEPRRIYLKLTGGGQACTVTLAPNTASKVWIIENATSYTLTFTQGSGANVAILASQTKMLATDGAGGGAVVYDMLQDLAVPDLFVDDDLKLQSDSAVLGFGADNDTTLTHTDGTGLTLNSTNKICFNDVSQFIQGSSATVLSLGATDEIDLTATAVDLNGTLDVSGNSQFSGTITVGVDGTGLDVKFFGATSGAYMLWDESADDLKLVGAAGFTVAGNIDIDGTANLDVVDIDGATQADGTITVGVDDTGFDVKFFGATSGSYMLWDESADDLKLVGAAGLTVAGNADIDGTTNLDAVDIDGAVQADGTITVGVDDTGYDVKFFGATASAYMLWDESADDLILAGAARVVVPASGLVIGSTAVSSTAAELNLLDGLDRGSILYGNASSATTVLGQGSADQVLTSDGTDISWEDAASGGISGLTGLVENNSIWLGNDPSGTTSTAEYCTALGTTALDAITTGDKNTAVGYGAQGADDVGYFCTAIGYNALSTQSVGGHTNTCIGYQAGLSATTGSMNVFIGTRAAENQAGAGHNNVVIGQYSASTLTTGDGNVSIGSSSNVSTADAANQTVLGYNVTGNADNSLCFGTGSTDSAIAYGETSITAPSDIRLKEDIQDEVVGLDFINELRPVTFIWKKAKDVPSDMKVHSDSEERVMNGKYNHGFIAQEVKEVIDNNSNIKEGFSMWSEDDIDGRQRIGGGALIPMLVKAVQELSAEVKQLKSKLEE